MSAVGGALILIGSAFSALAALGLLRLPDVYTRLHAAAKAGPLGTGMILLGVGIDSTDILTLGRCLLGLAFLLLVSPISGHLLARAALRSGAKPSNITSIEEIG